ncbi:MAG: hypothetical protein KF847_21090 [Pirellulales bacterium]|nr:hypothetical protein [Pirellulales bacterium]
MSSLTNSTHVTHCECRQAGWCSRHACFKSRDQFLLCQRRPELFAQWERGEGPGQRHEPSQAARLRVLTTPCRHRSAEPIGEAPCELCGAERRLAPVYACAKFTECTLYRVGRSERHLAMGACLGCDDYEPRDGP